MVGACAWLGAALALAAPGADGALEVIEKLNAGLESVLREAGQLDYRARYDRLTPVLGAAFDFDFMARQALGRQWESLSAEDQRRWVAVFRELTTATYASRFDHSSGQSFATLGVDESAHDTVMVRSRVNDPGGENVDLTYRLRHEESSWKVIDVYLKGSVSEVALRRSEYAAVLKRDGFAALLEAAQKRIERLAAGQGTTP